MHNYIQFINHASFVVSNGNKSILTDPWYTGSVFNNSWNLLYENRNKDIEKILKNIDYIWISHEHPDHFSIPFFKTFKSIIQKKNIKILFQETYDKRVIKFLKNNNYDVVELKDNLKFIIDDNFQIKIVKYGIYDSAIIFYIDSKKIFNLNDCPIRSKKELVNFNKSYGECDILLSQFSYAAWKGEEKEIEKRISAAKEKINTLNSQIEILQPKFYIPIASLIWFSHIDNFFMNDSINKIVDLPSKILSKKIKIILMSPYEKQIINDLNQSIYSINFWKDKYKEINFFNKNHYISSIQSKDLLENSKVYKNSIFNFNSKFLMKIFKVCSFNYFFSPIKIYLSDLDIIYNFDFFKNDYISNKSINSFDVKFHSSSLNFIFKNLFGFDTLTVNGLFKVNKNGFKKMLYNYGIGNLNNIGIAFDLRFLLDFKLIFYILKLLIRSKKLT
jgi:UDP-MurNAc hydroxylase